jgi:Zn-dependent M16 (insulinase) family peptidase
VVFNEMKGAMSSADSQFTRRLSSEVFPTSTYHHNSGGDPKNIPELTHKQLVDFHATHYHPSNACIFSYGDLPLEETLQRVDAWALVKFDRLDVSNLDVTDEIRLTVRAECQGLSR